MRVLVTGGTGLIGARLLPRLVEAGVEIRALMRRERDAPSGVSVVTGDLDQVESLEQAVAGTDAVVHLAALFRTTDEEAVWRTNLDGTRNLLEAVRRAAPGARLVFASTGNVYGDELARPGREDDDCTPTAAYPASKIAAEQLVIGSGLSWTIVRLPFVYGDGDGHVASLSALAARFGLHPAHTYSVAHHRDVAAVVRMSLKGRLDGRIVNLTDDAPVTVLEMTTLAGDPVEGSAEPLLHPWSGRMDSGLLRSLGFRPTVPTMVAAAADGLL